MCNGQALIILSFSENYYFYLQFLYCIDKNYLGVILVSSWFRKNVIKSLFKIIVLSHSVTFIEYITVINQLCIVCVPNEILSCIEYLWIQ